MHKCISINRSIEVLFLSIYPFYLFSCLIFCVVANLTCHKECMGGCRNERADGCHVCRNYFSLDDRTCVRECPKDQYILSSLCVNATYCINKKKKPILGECRNSCPLIISEKFVNISSVDQCARECPATEVDSLATSDLLRGCQIVKGDLINSF